MITREDLLEHAAVWRLRPVVEPYHVVRDQFEARLNHIGMAEGGVER